MVDIIGSSFKYPKYELEKVNRIINNKVGIISLLDGILLLTLSISIDQVMKPTLKNKK